MITTLSELTIRRMLTLTQAALHGIEPDENLFVNAGETEWNELFELSVQQGVMVLSLNGVQRLPRNLHPSLPLKLRWIAGVENVEKRYRHRLETAKELAARFKENNIRMMLFKGFALSRLYPLPYSREFGDIDIFLCGKAKEGDALLEHIAGKKCRSSKKNTNFIYKGILIENHYTFLYHNSYKSFHGSEQLEKQLSSFLTEAGCLDEANIAGLDTDNEALLFPPPNFDALYVTLHLLGHLSSKIVLRHLCDLTVLYNAYKGKIDFSLYRDALSEAGLLKLADACISLCVRYLGLNPEDAPPYESDLVLENRLWNDMLNPEVLPLPKEKHTFFNIIMHKIRLIQTSRWKFELVYPGKFRNRIIYSIYLHLFHPKIITRL